MIVSVTDFIPLLPLSIVSTKVMWKSIQWLGKNIVRSYGKQELQESMDRCTGRHAINQSNVRYSVFIKYMIEHTAATIGQQPGLTLHSLQNKYMIPKEGIRFNHFPNKPFFSRVCSPSLLETPWEKKKSLVTSNFSFSHRVFYHFGKHSPIFYKFKIVVCKLSRFGRA